MHLPCVRTLVIEFTNHEVKQYNIVHLLKNLMFAPLRQPAFFKNFKVEQGGYGIVWNEDIDLSEYELWKNGITVAESVGVARRRHPSVKL
ncbi:MAG: DUF2442 domain-containing protein [Microcoleus sp. PH2017_01_SCD_O_A]|jgi:hypothetical protein|uniref:DUF2442 domain-containing protein n=1 Tax=unclassified Microcoleus TaxID=2642155 RepID=UPI001DF77679|nr:MULTISPECIES: DUF2442 domain-containing protein [unclassified Microcoleus]TAG66921.1 MAG: DUF2442 domain-containing protein [Oscillatoriales cyanobacterium]MCC3422425.1 DUF2442 domain-containing protein [Microcoleus sp. PH2017_01_SCD_O_A]MCC3474674.1 DUF2442 domain-containing protein [Microcoleus sp. PH2017_13_LAR_U_A]MCC3487156.1 DUF2442 domain-containing protein [Microcoleus sp. PH2017_14_LAR_D_A]MCC3599493.1 DUF2442 domain-containing protein [Microcoleus sp. PH2017_26_ELK_O_A]